MACRLIISELANGDLDEIVGYMVNELKSPDAAANLLDAMEADGLISASEKEAVLKKLVAKLKPLIGQLD